VKPYQPDGYLATLNFPKREYAASHGDDLYRRGVYTLWQRTFLQPSLLNFDAPTREECTVNRVSSNTPLQALDLLNDPIYVGSARCFAENAQKAGHSNPDRLGVRTALSRGPAERSGKVLQGLYRRIVNRISGDPKAAYELIHVGEKPVAPGIQPAVDRGDDYGRQGDFEPP
jgi:hypothetical protein